jgi:hypothetical protein
MAEAQIFEAVRTAGGRRSGKLAGWHPADMAAETLNAIVDRSGIDPAAIEDVPYRDLRTSQWRKHGVAVFCLSPDANYVHLILAASAQRRSARGRRGARMTGHLFQARFGSVAMDERVPDGGALCGFERSAGAVER